MLIYAITNTVNGKRYVGMTQMSLSERWLSHKKACRRGVSTALHNAMRKYGIEAFAISEIAMIVPGRSRQDMGTVEQAMIAQEGTLAPGGYNMTPGGDGIPRGFKHTKPSACAGKPWPEARRRNIEDFRNKQRQAWANDPKRRAAMSVRVSKSNEKRSASNV